MTEMPTRHQVLEAIAEKFATMPAEVDHHGKSVDEKARNAARMAQVLETSAYAQIEEPPAPQVGPKPNPAQGSSSAAPASPTGSGGSLLDRLRANAQAALDAGTGAA